MGAVTEDIPIFIGVANRIILAILSTHVLSCPCVWLLPILNHVGRLSLPPFRVVWSWAAAPVCRTAKRPLAWWELYHDSFALPEFRYPSCRSDTYNTHGEFNAENHRLHVNPVTIPARQPVYSDRWHWSLFCCLISGDIQMPGHGEHFPPLHSSPGSTSEDVLAAGCLTRPARNLLSPYNVLLPDDRTQLPRQISLTTSSRRSNLRLAPLRLITMPSRRGMLGGKRTSGAVGPLVFVTVLILLPIFPTAVSFQEATPEAEALGGGAASHARLSSCCAYHSALPAEQLFPCRTRCISRAAGIHGTLLVRGWCQAYMHPSSRQEQTCPLALLGAKLNPTCLRSRCLWGGWRLCEARHLVDYIRVPR